MRRQPLFSGVVVALVAMASGSTLTLLALARVIVFEALPYEDADRLISFRWADEEQGIPDMALSFVDAQEFPQRAPLIEAVSATLTPLDLSFGQGDRAVHVYGGLASSASFSLLGVQPVLGRAFLADEEAPGSAERVVALSHEFWVRELGGDPDVIGGLVELDRLSYRVVGVLPPHRTLAPEQSLPIDVWLPIGLAEALWSPGVLSNPGGSVFRVNGRVREGATPEALAAALDAIEAGMSADYPDSHEGWVLHAERLRDRMFGSLRSPLLALLAGSFTLAAVALVNLLGLFIHQSEKERQDDRTRTALGAGPRELRLDALGRAAALGAIAGGFGSLSIVAGMALFRQLNPVDLPPHMVLAPGAVLLFSPLLLGPAACVAAAAVPLRHSRTARARSRRSRRGSNGWLAAQLALTTLLMVGSFSLARSLAELENRPTGMDTSGLLSARMQVSSEVMAPSATAPLAREVIRAVEEQPGIESAFIWSPALPSEARTYTLVVVQDGRLGEDALVARYHSVTAGAAGGFGLRFAAGRDFTSEDRDAGRWVALVSASAARQWWGSEDDAIGRSLRRTRHSEWSEVVGVVEDAAFSGRFGPGSANVIDVFFLFDRDPRSTLIVLARGAPGVVRLEEVARAVSEVHRDVPYFDQRWMADRVRDQEGVHRGVALVSAVYAALALIISTIGLGGLALLSARRRRREIAIRKAVGAAPARITRDLLARWSAPLGLGLAVGWLAARGSLSVLDPVLLTVGPTDVVSHTTALAVVVAVAGSALVLPLVAAARAEPVGMLRSR